MAGAMSGSLIGLVYNGKFKKEPDLTVVKHLAYEQWHICKKEDNSQKKIIAITDTEVLAQFIIKHLSYAITDDGERWVG